MTNSAIDEGLACHCGAKLIWTGEKFDAIDTCGEPYSFIMDVYGPAQQKLAEVEFLIWSAKLNTKPTTEESETK